MYLNFTVFLGLLLGMMPVAHSQSIQIRGRVIDAQSRAGVEGIYVNVDGKAAETNQQGYFVVNVPQPENLQIGNFQFSVKVSISHTEEHCAFEGAKDVSVSNWGSVGQQVDVEVIELYPTPVWRAHLVLGAEDYPKEAEVRISGSSAVVSHIPGVGFSFPLDSRDGFPNQDTVRVSIPLRKYKANPITFVNNCSAELPERIYLKKKFGWKLLDWPGNALTGVTVAGTATALFLWLQSVGLPGNKL